ncbi:MAG: AI-2E family transporter [Butyrivibrio sp.]|nr:AI-2E family transporter [Butyrivibrio sp.]
MKYKLTRKQLTWGLTIFLTFVACLLVVYVLFKGSTIVSFIADLFYMMRSIIIGLVIAFILSPILNFIESKIIKPIYRKKFGDYTYPKSIIEKKKVRLIGLLFTMIIFFFILYALCLIIIPQLYKSIVQIIVNFPTYVQNVQDYTDNFLSNNPEIRNYVNTLTEQYSGMINNFLKDTVMPNLSNIVNRISKSFLSVIKGFLNFVVGIIVAIYILNSKEVHCAQGKKLAYAFFKEPVANEIVSACRVIHSTFTGFFVGKIMDSIIIGIICYVGCLILGIPYSLLVSFIVGMTNIIPFFGPYIGGLMGAILLVLINPMSALIFIIFVVILQQFDGNILGPKILGNTTGLSSFWVIFSIMLFGGLFGFVGWIVGVPIFAVFYYFVRRITNHLLRRRGIYGTTVDYVDVAYIEKGTIKSLSDRSNKKFNAVKPPSAFKKIFKVKSSEEKMKKNTNISDTQNSEEDSNNQKNNNKKSPI